MNNQIEYAGWLQSSCDDGPGMRSVLFLQGCSKNCIGCQNKKIKEHGKGTMVNVNALIEAIDSECPNKKITISGGEPLEQMDSLLNLVKKLKKKGYNICVYTGWDLESVPSKIFEFIDYIKTGSFISSLMDPDIQYVGSGNQHMYSVKEGNIEELSIAI